MFSTPKKQKSSSSSSLQATRETNPPATMNQPTSNPKAATSASTINPTAELMKTSAPVAAAATTTATTTTGTLCPSATTTVVFENGTMAGSMASEGNANLSGTSSNGSYVTVPEIVISSGCSLGRSRCSLNRSSSSINRGRGTEPPASVANTEDMAVESTALLDTEQPLGNHNEVESQAQPPHMLADEFEQFILNRTTSESNILESSIYSELQFPPSVHGGSMHGVNGYVSSSGGPIAAAAGQMAGPQTPSSASQTGRQTKRTKRKHKTKTKCTAAATAANLAAAAGQRASPNHHYPPRYTAIFMDPQYGNVMTATSAHPHHPHHHHHHPNGNAANALGQIASAAASSPFLNAPLGAGESAAAAAAYMQQFQYFQQRPMVTTAMGTGGHRRHHRSLFETSGTTTAIGIDNPLNGLAPASPESAPPPTGITAPVRLSFRKWFSRPSLPFIIGILALGGVACTLGGIVLGSTGLIEHSTQYLSAALLMIGIGVSLLVISGAIWRLSLPDDVDECPCYRHMEMCRNCNSPYCNSRLMGGGYLYPEFQHRPPPPSYLTSLNECAGMSLLFHPTASAQHAAHYSTIRVNTPPPLYRSTNSLSVFGNGSSSALASLAPPNSMGIMPADHTAIAMSTVMENLQAQTQPLIKEFNYLELD